MLETGVDVVVLAPVVPFTETGLEADALHAEVRMMNGMNSNSIVRMRPGVAPMNKSPLTNALNLEMILLKMVYI